MIPHGHDEKIIAGYDPVIVRRLLAYGAPHLRLIIGALICLAIATAGEMLVPVMIQRTIDHEILDYRVRLAPEALKLFERQPAEQDVVDGWVYVREELLDQINRPVRDALIADSDIDTTRYYVASAERLRESPELRAALGPSLIAENDAMVVITRDGLDALPRALRMELRAANVEGLARNVLLFLGILLSVLLASFGQVYLTAWTGQLVMKELRVETFGHTIHQHLGFLGNQAVGRLVTRATNDVETINELFTSVLADLTRNIGLMIAVVITMVSLNARLAAIVIATMLPIVLLTEIFRRKAREAYRQVRTAVSAVNAYLSEYLSGMAVVQMFVQQARSRREFGSRNGAMLRAHLSELRVFAVFRPIVDFMATLSTTALIFFGARLVAGELVSLGVLIAFTNLIRRFYMPVMNISEQFTVLQSAMAGAERVFALLDEDHRIPDTGERTLDRNALRGAIAFEDVHFAYKVHEPVIRGLTFRAEPGELVAIVGYTGAGKTTIINLLTRLWDIDRGTITLDGFPLTEYRLSDLRRTVQQIQQDVYLFDDTIRNNITLGADVSDDEIRRACTAVQVMDYIDSLPEGLDTRLHERGTNLSAGQRQLIAFARVLVNDPPVLVLDEATSSIDSDTEQRLQHAVDAVTGGRTSVVIAHRISTIQHADRILVLSHGELVESGTHAELIAANGLYATLYQLQYERRDTLRD